MNTVYCRLDGTAIDDLDVQLLMTIPAAAATTTPPTVAALKP